MARSASQSSPTHIQKATSNRPLLTLPVLQWTPDHWKSLGSKAGYSKPHWMKVANINENQYRTFANAVKEILKKHDIPRAADTDAKKAVYEDVMNTLAQDFPRFPNMPKDWWEKVLKKCTDDINRTYPPADTSQTNDTVPDAPVPPTLGGSLQPRQNLKASAHFLPPPSPPAPSQGQQRAKSSKPSPKKKASISTPQRPHSSVSISDADDSDGADFAAAAPVHITHNISLAAESKPDFHEIEVTVEPVENIVGLNAAARIPVRRLYLDFNGGEIDLSFKFLKGELMSLWDVDISEDYILCYSCRPLYHTFFVLDDQSFANAVNHQYDARRGRAATSVIFCLGARGIDDTETMQRLHPLAVRACQNFDALLDQAEVRRIRESLNRSFSEDGPRKHPHSPSCSEQEGQTESAQKKARHVIGDSARVQDEQAPVQDESEENLCHTASSDEAPLDSEHRRRLEQADVPDSTEETSPNLEEFWDGSELFEAPTNPFGDSNRRQLQPVYDDQYEYESGQGRYRRSLSPLSDYWGEGYSANPYSAFADANLIPYTDPTTMQEEETPKGDEEQEHPDSAEVHDHSEEEEEKEDAFAEEAALNFGDGELEEDLFNRAATGAEQASGHVQMDVGDRQRFSRLFNIDAKHFDDVSTRVKLPYWKSELCIYQLTTVGFWVSRKFANVIRGGLCETKAESDKIVDMLLWIWYRWELVKLRKEVQECRERGGKEHLAEDHSLPADPNDPPACPTADQHTIGCPCVPGSDAANFTISEGVNVIGVPSRTRLEFAQKIDQLVNTKRAGWKVFAQREDAGATEEVQIVDFDQGTFQDVTAADKSEIMNGQWLRAQVDKQLDQDGFAPGLKQNIKSNFGGNVVASDLQRFVVVATNSGEAMSKIQQTFKLDFQYKVRDTATDEDGIELEGFETKQISKSFLPVSLVLIDERNETDSDVANISKVLADLNVGTLTAADVYFFSRAFLINGVDDLKNLIKTIHYASSFNPASGRAMGRHPWQTEVTRDAMKWCTPDGFNVFCDAAAKYFSDERYHTDSHLNLLNREFEALARLLFIRGDYNAVWNEMKLKEVLNLRARTGDETLDE